MVNFSNLRDRKFKPLVKQPMICLSLSILMIVVHYGIAISGSKSTENVEGITTIWCK